MKFFLRSGPLRALLMGIEWRLGEPEAQVPIEYAQSVCNLYAQLSARGVTVLHSSGDQGAGANDAGARYANCSTPNRFRAQFPSSCP